MKRVNEYTRAGLLEAVRLDYPKLRSVSDEELFAAIATDHPDMVRGRIPSDRRAAAKTLRYAS